ncbi:MAG: DNRLRE domain-containing protein [bacterium]
MKKCTLIIIGIFIISFLNIKADMKTFGTNGVGVMDTNMQEAWPDDSQEAYHTYYICPGGVGTEKRALLKFKNIFKSDGGTIENGSTIQFAYLALRYYQSGSFTSGKFEVYRVKKDWGEGTSTNSKVEIGAACWDAPKHGFPKWEKAGCDGESDRTQIGIPGEALCQEGSTGNKDIAIDITSFVQAWSNGEPNYGLIIISKGLGGDRTAGFAFRAHEQTVS